ncbi:BTAD domain-containing putative transcriptional regulator [Actinokineospora sp. G85]|uniref:BTAD domain-containing putative transcriptional regulator n=1 Tax=Actinokineospora sp. G85 TaxID=3406626 RepID=UPI003C784234
MKYRVLGPLEVLREGERVPVNGMKQRAVLGYLLFNANRVVSTSELLDALWPADDQPNSARKILHNAIWGLRGTLSEAGDADGGIVETRAPGYLLRVPAGSLDLDRFRRLAAAGHAHLAAGDSAAAAAGLRAALDLWRGDALADLVEAGYAWSELAAVESCRVDVVEDWFEAELAEGRHQVVLREIETAAEEHRLRERLCGQLMVALYRCGRQADALNAYARIRELLVDELGLEPGLALRELQQAILRHDAALSGPAARAEVLVRERPGPAAPAAVPAIPAARDGRGHQPASVLLVQAALDNDGGEVDDSRVDLTLAAVSESLRSTVACLGGALAAPLGSTLLAVFPAGLDAGEAPRRAVSAALAVLGCLAGRTSGDEVSIRAAIATGPVELLREGPGDPVLRGEVLQTGQSLLARTAGGSTRVCDATRAAAGPGVDYVPATGSRVRHANWLTLAHPTIPVVDRDGELDLLARLLDRSRHRGVAQLVTVLGDFGVGKSRTLLEFERRALAKHHDVRFLHCGAGGAAARWACCARWSWSPASCPRSCCCPTWSRPRSPPACPTRRPPRCWSSCCCATPSSSRAPPQPCPPRRWPCCARSAPAARSSWWSTTATTCRTAPSSSSTGCWPPPTAPP